MRELVVADTVKQVLCWQPSSVHTNAQQTSSQNKTITITNTNINITPDLTMESLKRNQTTAAEAMALEEGIKHPMPIQNGKLRNSQYFFLLHTRRELPVSGKREEFLSLYQSEQVSYIYIYIYLAPFKYWSQSHVVITRFWSSSVRLGRASRPRSPSSSFLTSGRVG